MRVSFLSILFIAGTLAAPLKPRCPNGGIDILDGGVLSGNTVGSGNSPYVSGSGNGNGNPTADRNGNGNGHPSATGNGDGSADGSGNAGGLEGILGGIGKQSE